ncbi:MAG TPA: two-component regulator propeller domain-containing protein, partial [Bryobacteraceae bacterium]|nr:two-component regulator propeller domain-containing protein [Bryobacteraceae bacterium]
AGGSSLWLGTHDNLCRWIPGSPADCSIASGLSVRAMAPSANGMIVGDGATKSVVRVSGGIVKTLISKAGDAPPSVRLMRRDRDGNVWVAVEGEGLFRIFHDAYERFGAQEGLSSNLINALVEDREGNVWVGTARGIDRFREPSVRNLSTRNGLSSDAVGAIAPGPGGAVWVGTSRGLDYVDGATITHYRMTSGPSVAFIAALCEDSGVLWAGATGGLARLSGGRLTALPRPPALSNLMPDAFAKLHPGDIAVADYYNGIFSLRDGALRPMAVPGAQGKLVYALAAGPGGALWVGYYQGGLTILKDGQARFVDAAAGLAAGPVEAIYQDRAGAVWVGASGGLSRFRNTRWTTWTAAQNLPDGGVQDIVEDDRGSLWAVTPGGILRLSQQALQATPDGQPARLAYSIYGLTEGLRIQSPPGLSHPRLVKSSDGRLWMRTSDGVAVLDPSRIHQTALPPPVVVEQLVADGKTIDTSSGLPVAFRGREVQLTYTGLSLSVPEAIRFRYRLVGLEKNWTDAGARRYVAYVNLPPAKYSFRVQACNSQGMWNLTGAALSFEISPQFYQTKWFPLACAFAITLAAWGAYQMRVRAVVSRFRLVAQERARMTRELHDSLLQGFSGVVFQLEAVTRLFDSNPVEGKRRLDRAIEHADQSLHEARRAIMNMHLPELEGASLSDALQAAGARAVEGSAFSFHFAARGHVRELPYDVQAALYLVGREAMVNAINHSGGRRVAAELTYSARSVSLSIQDDGKGFNQETAEAKEGHRGLLGMRERARQIGATLTFHSSAGQGTRVGLVAPLKS